MAKSKTKRRYIEISGNGLPFCVVEPSEAWTMLDEFLGSDDQPMSEPVVLTERWMTDAEFDALPEWEG